MHPGALQDAADQTGDIWGQHLANREIDRDRQALVSSQGDEAVVVMDLHPCVRCRWFATRV